MIKYFNVFSYTITLIKYKFPFPLSLETLEGRDRDGWVTFLMHLWGCKAEKDKLPGFRFSSTDHSLWFNHRQQEFYEITYLSNVFNFDSGKEWCVA